MGVIFYFNKYDIIKINMKNNVAQKNKKEKELQEINFIKNKVFLTLIFTSFVLVTAIFILIIV